LPVDVRDRFLTLGNLSGDYNTSLTDNQSRLLVWSRDVEATLKRPIGFGIGTAPAVDGILGGNYMTAHNSVVQCFVELGFLGLLFYFRSCYQSWRGLRKLEKSSRAVPTTNRESVEACASVALYARALRMSLLGNFVAGAFISQAYAPILWTLVGLVGALLAIADTNRPPREAGAV
jgi:O-antigen ligase